MCRLVSEALGPSLDGALTRACARAPSTTAALFYTLHSPNLTPSRTETPSRDLPRERERERERRGGTREHVRDAHGLDLRAQNRTDVCVSLSDESLQRLEFHKSRASWSRSRDLPTTPPRARVFELSIVARDQSIRALSNFNTEWNQIETCRRTLAARHGHGDRAGVRSAVLEEDRLRACFLCVLRGGGASRRKKKREKRKLKKENTHRAAEASP